MRNYLFAILFMHILHSCVTPILIKDGDTAFQYKRYNDAIQFYIKEIDAETDEIINANKYYYLAESYHQVKNIKEAANAYRKAYELGFDPIALWKAATALQQEEQYEDAIALYRQYGQQVINEKQKAQAAIYSCHNAIEWMNDTLLFDLVNLECNTPFDEFATARYNDYLYFTTNRNTNMGTEKYHWNDKKFYDILSYHLMDNQIIDTFNNTIYNDGPMTMTADGRTIIYTQCGRPGTQDDYCRLYMITKKPSGNWTTPEYLQLFEEDTINITQPFITANGDKLFFVCDEFGIGGSDIFTSNYTSEGWSEPVNLGSSINTEGNEMFPTYYDNTLYFSSDTWQGMGGLDIFKATAKEKKFKIENLKYPINSSGDDFALLPYPLSLQDKKDSIILIAHFNSNRKNGKGDDDIYFIKQKIPPPPPKPAIQYELHLSVMEKLYNVNNNPSSGIKDSIPLTISTIQLIDQKDSLFTIFSTNELGDLITSLDSNRYYQIIVNAPEFFTQTLTFDTYNQVAQSKNNKIILSYKVVLEKIFKNQEIILEDIFYDLNKTNIREDAKPVLDKLVLLLNQNPSIHIELGSHTDCRSSSDYNQSLSQGRAQSVVEYLVRNGIDPSRLTAKGYGESNPVELCTNCSQCTEEQHQRNRRTTFKVL